MLQAFDFPVMQLLLKLKASAAFLEEARNAQEGYVGQMELADSMLDTWVQKQKLIPGESLTWMWRPDTAQVSFTTTSSAKIFLPTAFLACIDDRLLQVPHKVANGCVRPNLSRRSRWNISHE